MAAVIKLKRGTSTPSTSDIASGEVAIDTSAQKFYINDSGTVKEIGGGGGGLLSQDSANNIKGGTDAGAALDGDTLRNLLIGYKAGEDINSGDDNICIGYDAGKQITEGSNNLLMGYQAGYIGTEFSNCVGLGLWSLRDNTSGNANTGVGIQSLRSINSGYFNVGVGYQTALSTTSGNSNTFLGGRAAYDLSTGSQNTVIGMDAGNSGTNDITTGSNNILLGYQAAASSATVSNEVTIGDTNITKFRIPGLNFVVKDTTATEDYVLTVDANGEAGWEAAAGGTPTAITVADESSDTTCFPLFATAATGDLGPKSGSNLTFNSSTGALAATLLNGGAGDDLSLDFGSVA